MAEIEQALDGAPMSSPSTGSQAQGTAMQHLHEQNCGPPTSLSSSSTAAPAQAAMSDMQHHHWQNRAPSTSLSSSSTAAPAQGECAETHHHQPHLCNPDPQHQRMARGEMQHHDQQGRAPCTSLSSSSTAAPAQGACAEMQHEQRPPWHADAQQHQCMAWGYRMY